MKLRLGLFIFCISIISVLQAQKVQYGVTTALNFGNISGKGMSSKYQTGFNAGAFAVISLNKKISLQPELLYSLSKISRSDNFTTYYVSGSRYNSNQSFNIAYLSVPVLVNYRFNKMITVNAGPQFNLLVYENENLMYSKDAIKKNDFGVKAGVQFTISSKFNLFASYYNGLANINNIDDRYKWSNRQFQIGTNISLFNVGRK
jgi:hypothetical protein